jgi:hypothetical protein
MPHNSSIPVCNITRLLCTERAVYDWLENDASYMDNRMPCNCFPSCAEIKYEMRMIDKNPFDWLGVAKAYGDDFEKVYPG